MEEALNATTLLLERIIWRKICGNLNIFAKDAGNNGDTLVQSGIMILNWKSLCLHNTIQHNLKTHKQTK